MSTFAYTVHAAARAPAWSSLARRLGWAFPTLVAAFALSCSSATPAPAPAAGKGQMSMTINGVPWVARGKVSGAVSSTVIAVGGDLDAAGSEQLTINIYKSATGTYEVDKAAKAKDGSVVSFNKQSDFYLSDIKTSKFTVVITKATGVVVEGTFSGTFEEGQASASTALAPKLVITEGKFATVE